MVYWNCVLTSGFLGRWPRNSGTCFSSSCWVSRTGASGNLLLARLPNLLYFLERLTIPLYFSSVYHMATVYSSEWTDGSDWDNIETHPPAWMRSRLMFLQNIFRIARHELSIRPLPYSVKRFDWSYHTCGNIKSYDGRFLNKNLCKSKLKLHVISHPISIFWELWEYFNVT